MSYQSWGTDLHALRRTVDGISINEIPPKAAEWFDLNRGYLAGKFTSEEGVAKLHELRGQMGATPWPLEWRRMKANGWFISLAHYKRDGVPYWLLNIARQLPATAKDYTLRKRFVGHLGGDPDKDFLMFTGPDECQDLVASWTWPKNRGQV